MMHHITHYRKSQFTEKAAKNSADKTQVNREREAQYYGYRMSQHGKYNSNIAFIRVWERYGMNGVVRRSEVSFKFLKEIDPWRCAVLRFGRIDADQENAIQMSRSNHVLTTFYVNGRLLSLQVFVPSKGKATF